MKAKSRNTWAKKLLAAVEAIDRPGVFCVGGVAAAVLPGLEVEGVGSIGLPLSESQASELKSRCERAAHGKGERTIVDTAVRRVWRLTPDRFKLTNPAWAGVLREMVGRVQRELGLEGQSLQPHLYDLLLYEKGDFFLPHRDGEKLDRMVATLVVALPSDHAGGALIVRHEGQERTIEFGGEQARFQTQFAAFYADCEHEVKPLASGHRLCLIYNLVLSKSKGPAGAPRCREHVEKIAALLSQWPDGDADPRKAALTLEHQYTEKGLSWDALKGVDAARARILADAAAEAGCRAYLALLTFWETGSSEGDEYDDYHSYKKRRYDDDDEDDENGDDEDQDTATGAGEYEMTEVFDSSLTADSWRSPDDTPTVLGSIPIQEHEILPEGSLKEVKPEEDFEGYTGNAGMTLDRWYRRAAILLWPDARHFDVLCEAGVDQATGGLAEMARAAKKAAGDPSAAKQRCRQLAERILLQWPERTRIHRPWDDAQADAKGATTADPLSSLEYIDDPALIRLYLRDVLSKDTTLEPGDALTRIVSRHGWTTFQSDLASLFQQTGGAALARNVKLLDRLCDAASRVNSKTSAEARDACTPLAEALVDALIRIDAQPQHSHGHIRHIDITPVLIALARALLTIDADDALARLTAHVASTPSRYPLQSVQAPALIELSQWAKKNRPRESRGLSTWWEHGVREFEALTAAEPQPPADFRRPANVKCTCPDCAQLSRFLADPTKHRHEFQMVQDRRSHVESQVRAYQCDIDCTTDRRPRPQILICIKNTATYHRLLKEYRQNLKHLADLRSIRLSAQLPTSA